jgi:hypothetical protein
VTDQLQLFQSMVPSTKTPLASREGIAYMESVLRGCSECEIGSDTETFPVKHKFADGVYAREILLPAGTVVIGKIHKFGHINVISEGHVSVLTEFGVDELFGPCTFISKPGTKRVVYAHESTVWTTFHGTHHTDPDSVEADIICKTFADYDSFKLEIDRKAQIEGGGI